MKTSPFAVTLIACLSFSFLLGCGSAKTSGSGVSGSSAGSTAALLISAVSPGTIPAGVATTLTITGTGFTSATTVQVNGISLPTTFGSATQITVAVPATQFPSGATVSVVASDHGVSTSSTGPTLEVDNPAPVLTALSPAAVQTGTAGATVSVSGTALLPGTVLQANGTARVTTILSGTAATMALTPADLAQAGTLTLTAVNPAPGGGTSSPLAFSVTNPVPAISAVSPSFVLAGSAATTVTLTGTNFAAGAMVAVNGSTRHTTITSGTALTFALTPADQATAATLHLTVTNPAPGGGISTAASLPVNNPVPGPLTISPASLVVGSTPVIVTVSGSNFVQGSIVQVNRAARATTFVSATAVTFLPAVTDLATAGSLSVTVTNPNSTGGTSAPATLAVMDGTPIATSLSPSAVGTGSYTNLPIITIAGFGFAPDSQVAVNGNTRATTFISATQLKFSLQYQDQSHPQTLSVTVVNPAPAGGISMALSLAVFTPPSIQSVSPSALVKNPSATVASSITLNGTFLSLNATVQADGHPIAITSQTATQIVVSLPASYVTTAHTILFTVANPSATPGNSPITAGASLPILDPGASFSITPNSAVAGGPDLKITISQCCSGGNILFPDTIVQWNGIALATTVNTSNYQNQITAIVPASLLAHLGTATISLSALEYAGQASATQPFSTYLSLPANDLVWNSHDGLIYATIAGSAGPGLGNSLVGIQPNTGVIQKTIFVGSEPNRLAISTDGTQAFVGLDKAGAFRQVDLVTNVAGAQTFLGGGQNFNSPLTTAVNFAAVPGQTNSVALYTNAGTVNIFDAGVARPNSNTSVPAYFYNNYGALTFGPSPATLYLSSQVFNTSIYKLTVDATGITASTQLPTAGSGSSLQYDNGRLYIPAGLAADADTGATLGQFSTIPYYSSNPAPAAGPIVSDSSLNRVWILNNSFISNNTQILSFDETTYNPVSSFALTGISNSSYPGGSDLIRWGQSGLAFRTNNQVYIFQGPIVKDTSGTPADLAVTAQVPATATTGTTFTEQIKISNLGPNNSSNDTALISLPPSAIFGSVTTTQGTCNGISEIYCNLGTIANGASATISITQTPTLAGSLTTTASVFSQTYDAVESNNQINSTTVATGTLFSALPNLTKIAPNALAVGSPSFTLILNGSGFNTASAVLWNGASLPTTFVNASQVTAVVDASLLSQFGWANVAVSSPAPGGGQSTALTFSLYNVVNVPASAMSYDPFARKLYAALPSTSTTITGNSLVTIDPLTGVIGTPVQVGSEPNLLAETTSGNYLYIGLSGAKSVGRFNLHTHTLDLTVPLTSTLNYPTGPIATTFLATLPGVDNSVAAAQVGILDITGTTATVRINTDIGGSAVFTDPTHLYRYNTPYTQAPFIRSTITTAGIHDTDSTNFFGTGNGSTFVLDGGLLFFNGGGILNPATTPVSEIGVLPVAGPPPFPSVQTAGITPYAAEQKAFILNNTAYGSSSTYLQRFDLSHLVLEDQLPLLVQSGQNFGLAVTGVRWAQDGLAFLISGNTFGTTVPAQIILLRGPFVLPAEAVAHPAPALTIADSTTFAVNSGNHLLTVTGSGFLPGASLLWNGTILNTTFTDAQHLTANLGDAEVQTAATISLTAQNPGSTTSNALSVTVQ